jgi:hypothetical protein
MTNPQDLDYQLSLLPLNKDGCTRCEPEDGCLKAPETD